MAAEPLDEIVKTIQQITGIELTNQKLSLSKSRIMSRVRILKFSNIDDYIAYYHKNKETELIELVSLLTNHTTEFFRESEHFDILFDEIFPEVIKSKRPLRIWSAASSLGQEAFSIAITYLEVCELLGIHALTLPPIEILGTDIDTASIEKCMNGIYSKKSVEEQMDKNLARKYFDYGEGDLSHLVRIKDKVHQLCRFQVCNLFSIPPDLGYFDVIFLRNVLIYFKPHEVREIIETMQTHLMPSGCLFLGHSESLNDLGVSLNLWKNSIYKLRPASALMAKMNLENRYKETNENLTFVNDKTGMNEKIISTQSSSEKIIPVQISNEKSQSPKLIDKKHFSNFSKTNLIAIGSSTGGTEALKVILSQLNENMPPIVIVQHIPEKFSSALASRLNDMCKLEVCEAQSQQVLKKGTVYIAPGGKQMRILERDQHLIIDITDGERINLHKPSVDYLFNSLAQLKTKLKICAVILTGMGGDGAKGLKALYDKEAYTIAQNEESSVVFGMPKEAIALGAVHEVAPLNQISVILKTISIGN